MNNFREVGTKFWIHQCIVSRDDVSVGVLRVCRYDFSDVAKLLE